MLLFYWGIPKPAIAPKTEQFSERCPFSVFPLNIEAEAEADVKLFMMAVVKTLWFGTVEFESDIELPVIDNDCRFKEFLNESLPPLWECRECWTDSCGPVELICGVKVEVLSWAWCVLISSREMFSIKMSISGTYSEAIRACFVYFYK